jgi:hypothetical protein
MARVDADAMSKNASPLNQILRAVAKGRQRSALFWFLYQHHDEILTAAKGKLSWQHLVAEFRYLGLTDRNGCPPSLNTAKVTWQRVRRTLARERSVMATGVSSRQRQPSRMSPEWRPLVAAAEPTDGELQRRALETDPAASRSPTSQTNQDPEAMLAELRREVGGRSGRTEWDSRGRK